MALAIEKQATLPGGITADMITFVQGPAGYADLWIASQDGLSRRAVVDNARIQAVSAASSTAPAVVVDIDARNTLTATLSENKVIYVGDATADPTVNSGGALYIWDDVGNVSIKLAEFESMDVANPDWANIQNKPASSVAAIDAAVTNSHTHPNDASLDLLGGSGTQPTFNGANMVMEGTVAW